VRNKVKRYNIKRYKLMPVSTTRTGITDYERDKTEIPGKEH